MPLTHEEVLALKKELDERYDGRYVRISNCNDIQTENSKKFSKDDKRIEIMSHDFGTMKKLMWVVATTGIGSLLAAFFDLILK
jgi:hypothetical protein